MRLDILYGVSPIKQQYAVKPVEPIMVDPEALDLYAKAVNECSLKGYPLSALRISFWVFPSAEEFIGPDDKRAIALVNANKHLMFDFAKVHRFNGSTWEILSAHEHYEHHGAEAVQLKADKLKPSGAYLCFDSPDAAAELGLFVDARFCYRLKEANEENKP